MTGKIILLEDIYEIRKRKEQELQFYHNELEKLRKPKRGTKVEEEFS